MSGPDIPSTYTFKIKTDPDIDMNTTVGGTLNTTGSVSMSIDPVTTIMKGDPDQPVTTRSDVAMDLKNFPRLTLQDVYDLIDATRPRIRVRAPVQLNFGLSVFPLSLLGVDALTFSICGEPQLIVQDYVPNAYERCEVDCEVYED